MRFTLPFPPTYGLESEFIKLMGVVGGVQPEEEDGLSHGSLWTLRLVRLPLRPPEPQGNVEEGLGFVMTVPAAASWEKGSHFRK